MGRLPLIAVAIVAIWLALNVFREGPENALGGLFDLFYAPKYGEADRPTRSGAPTRPEGRFDQRVFQDESGSAERML